MASKEGLTGAVEPSEASPPMEYWVLQGGKSEDSGRPLASKDVIRESASERVDSLKPHEKQADEETKERQRTLQREREEMEEPATIPQPAGRGQPDTGTCGVPQCERSRTMAEAPEPQDPEPQNWKLQDPEPQNWKLQDPQSQAQKGHQEDKQTRKEEELTGPQSYSKAEECKKMDQAEEGSLHGQTRSQR